eukprot:CAMPEP_0117073674 /NCGR_PEP_ID=MMETSP0472-20121206/51879_1 /TAXON_ID=693140 ORGANISM="Tiarina fusus, Strain LIS" /NCGR_SAMPLE_ID=MMETSP0472 /ASSEMBLY_ACC=CAM_ASM_000603 /LENGTH=761 /DNA_ID=CAMNT_0004798329 /DNA_START=89 /DNA_END=2374 /DNA_ORIENTATION=+
MTTTTTSPFSLRLGWWFGMSILCGFLLPSTYSYRIGLLVKTFNNEFFQLAEQGCKDYVATFLTHKNSTCIYQGPLPTVENPNPDPDGTVQANMLLEMIPNVDALAISVKNAEAITPAIQVAIDAGIPVVTFDSDAPDSSRIAYVGTDNRFLGTTLAKVAKQISPEGGYFATLASDDSPNMNERIKGFQDEMFAENTGDDDDDDKDDANIVWTELSDSPGIFNRDVDVAIDMMEEYAQKDATVIVSVNGGPMWSDFYADFYNRNRRKNITLVFGDDFPLQIDYLSRGYVLGLVGQMPYEMGYRSTAALHNLLQGMEIPATIGTNLISHLQVPLVLPDLEVDHSLIGNLHYVGYVLFGIVGLMVLGCVGWTYRNRNLGVVKAAQPIFLLWVAFGVFTMGGALIPLSLDDKGDPDSLSDTQASLVCMSVPWLTWCGFTITFSALFSKTRRITKLIDSARECQRVQISAMDVAGPFIFLISLNVILLSLWTVLDPLVYVREANPGTDGWNRILSTYGACRSDHVARFLVPLGVVNFSVLLLANWQAYVSRRIKSEFAESKYIAFCMVSLLQALVTGFPVIYVVRDSPQAYYLVMAFMIFVICMAVLLLVFVPKMVLADDFGRRSDQSQRRLMVDAIRRSSTLAGTAGSRFQGGSSKSGPSLVSSGASLGIGDSEPSLQPYTSEQRAVSITPASSAKFGTEGDDNENSEVQNMATNTTTTTLSQHEEESPAEKGVQTVVSSQALWPSYCPREEAPSSSQLESSSGQ